MSSKWVDDAATAQRRSVRRHRGPARPSSHPGQRPSKRARHESSKPAVEGVEDPVQREKTRADEFLCTVKYRLPLPAPPVDPKLLKLPGKFVDVTLFNLPEIEARNPPPLDFGWDGGLSLNLVNPRIYDDDAHTPRALHPADAALLSESRANGSVSPSHEDSLKRGPAVAVESASFLKPARILSANDAPILRPDSDRRPAVRSGQAFASLDERRTAVANEFDSVDAVVSEMAESRPGCTILESTPLLPEDASFSERELVKLVFDSAPFDLAQRTASLTGLSPESLALGIASSSAALCDMPETHKPGAEKGVRRVLYMRRADASQHFQWVRDFSTASEVDVSNVDPHAPASAEKDPAQVAGISEAFSLIVDPETRSARYAWTPRLVRLRKRAVPGSQQDRDDEHWRLHDPSWQSFSGLPRKIELELVEIE